MMNCLFLNPPRRDNIIMVKEGRCMQRKGAWGYIMAPVTMVTIATLLRDDGHSVTVMDCPAQGMPFTSIQASVSRLSPDVVFINTSTPSIDDDVFAARYIKDSSPRPLTTVLFGIHPSCCYQELLENTAVDYCIIGEPEFTARELAGAIANRENLHSVAGIAFLDEFGT
jgi:radical SAM superfamily enzyme YgiQ (UPF0313 family)